MKPISVVVFSVVTITVFLFVMYYFDEGYYLYFPKRRSLITKPPTSFFLLLVLYLVGILAYLHSPKATACIFSALAVDLLFSGIFAPAAFQWYPGWGHIGLTVSLGGLSIYMWIHPELCADRS